MCTVPDEVRRATGTILVKSAQPNLNPELDILDVWVNNLPRMLEPDWKAAPEWAMWRAIDPDGQTIWSKEELMYEQAYWFHDRLHYSVDGCCEHAEYVSLPVGIDWRCTLRKRPEADQVHALEPVAIALRQLQEADNE